MSPTTRPAEERIAVRLSMREWGAAALLVLALLGLAPFLHLRPAIPVIERDYRIPYALSTRYGLYQRFTSLAAEQFPTILVGDSVVWGQCAVRGQTLSHHLNELAGEPRFANGGLDGMHPVALAELIEHHAPALRAKNILLQFNPLWLMSPESGASTPEEFLKNRPGLLPRLASGGTLSVKSSVSALGMSLVRNTPLRPWTEALSEVRMDFLAWSLDHPYENPRRAITSTLPPSDDSYPLKLTSWMSTGRSQVDSPWSGPEVSAQWSAFERLLSILELRENRILVLVGPMNESMMTPATRNSYLPLKLEIGKKLRARGIPYVIASQIPTDHFSDICHPLGAGYAEIAREVLETQPEWFRGSASAH